MKFDVILHKEDNGYWAEVPALKGCYTQGDTIDEIKDNIKEAITAWLSVDLSDTKEEIISIALWRIFRERNFVKFCKIMVGSW